MKKLLLIIFAFALCLNAQTLFEVKDTSNNTVLEVSADGLRIFNQGDTLMVISATDIRAYIQDSKDRALSRSFSISTNTTGKGVGDALEITTDLTAIGTGTTTMGAPGNLYTDFSPLNLFLGLDAGQNTIPNPLPFNAGDQTTWEGKFNIFIGNEAGLDNVDGYFNLFIGDKAGQNNTDGQKNTFVGSQSGQANASGGYNSHFGYNSGITSTGHYNTFMGANCGFNNGATHYNTYIGCASGEYFQGSNNTFLGYSAGRNAYTIRTGTGNVFIGSNVGSSSGSVSNKLYIDNSSTNTPLIYGEFDNDKIGINDNTPSANLHIKQVGAGEEGLAIENDGDTDVWSWEIGGNDLQLYFNDTYVGYWDDVDGSYTATSDERLKKDIRELNEPILDKVMGLQLVDYRLQHADKSAKKTLGFIAQDVQKLMPEIVKEREDGYLSLNYDVFGIISIKAIQEQQKKIVVLEKEINDLRSEIEEIKELLKK